MAEINTLQGAELRLPAASPVRNARDTAPRPDSATTAAPAPEPAWTREELDAALDKLRESLAKVRPEPFRVAIRNDEESDSLVILIKDSDGEVVKQYPPEKILNLHQKMDDLVGMIVDQTT